VRHRRAAGGGPALIGRHSVHLQRREGQREHLCQAAGRAIERRGQTAGAQYDAGQLGGEVGLPAALVCLGCPRSRLTNK
jgi:hypothetical protein